MSSNKNTQLLVVFKNKHSTSPNHLLTTLIEGYPPERHAASVQRWLDGMEKRQARGVEVKAVGVAEVWPSGNGWNLTNLAADYLEELA